MVRLLLISSMLKPMASSETTETHQQEEGLVPPPQACNLGCEEEEFEIYSGVIGEAVGWTQ